MSRQPSEEGALCTRCLPSGEARYSVAKSPPGPRRSNGVESICIIHKPSMHQPDRSRSTGMHHWGNARRILSEHPGWVIPLLRRGQPRHTNRKTHCAEPPSGHSWAFGIRYPIIDRTARKTWKIFGVRLGTAFPAPQRGFSRKLAIRDLPPGVTLPERIGSPVGRSDAGPPAA